MKILAFVFIIIFILLPTNSICADKAIVFLQNESCSNIDAHSFYPQMLLKHSFTKFYRLPKNPILKPSRNQWDSRDVADPFIVINDSNIFMFYDGDNDDHYHIGYARLSDDFWFWEKQGEILRPVYAGWESYHVIDPVVSLLSDNWYMWYSGHHADLPFGYSLGLAKSKNGQNWTRVQKQPVLKSSPDLWDFNGVAYADILFDNIENKFKMWYSGFFGPFASIGYAESDDGIDWRKQVEQPVYSSAPGIIAPDVIFNGEKYLMWYAQLNIENGIKTHIAMAESKNGTEWNFVKNVLSAQDRWEGSRLMSPAIAFVNQKIRLYYCAQSRAQWSIGEAFAEPVFETEGRWMSEVIPGTYKNLVMVYEQPLNTEISILANTGKGFQKLEIIESKKLPYNRKKSKFLLADINSQNIQININLKSTNLNNSPVIYSLKLVN